ncbi:MAG: prealbumin-like fold domain-containing protein, partial [Caldilineaceae bacterium]
MAQIMLEASKPGRAARLRLPVTLLAAALLALLLAMASSTSAQAQSGGSLSDVGPCAAARPGAPNNFNCTSSDVVIAEVKVTNGVTSCQAGEDVTLELATTFILNARERYDLGIYFALDGTSPVNGASCLRQQFDTAPPFQNLDNDICGDALSSVPIVDFPIPNTVTLKCKPGPNGTLVVPSLTFWENRAQPVCSEVPGTSAKCGLQEISLGEVQVKGTVTVIKVADPADSTIFDFNTTGDLVTSFQLNNDPGGAQTGPIFDRIVLEVPIVAGRTSAVNITETLPASGEWTLDAISCGGSAQFGTVFSAGNTGTARVSYEQPNATCIFTNRKKARVVVQKETLPTAAPETFGVAVTGGSNAVNLSANLRDGESF